MAKMSTSTSMKNSIYVRDGIVFYYKNPAGRMREDIVEVDAVFDKEDLKTFIKQEYGLDTIIVQGLYEKLLLYGEMIPKIDKEEITNIKKMFRIYQLKDSAPIELRFVLLDERYEMGYGKPKKDEYRLVYEEETDKFDLEEIWDRFSKYVNDDFVGNVLSISDVIELVDGDDSKFYYADSNFVEIDF